MLIKKSSHPSFQVNKLIEEYGFCWYQEEEQFYERYSGGKITLEEFADQSEAKIFKTKLWFIKEFDFLNKLLFCISESKRLVWKNLTQIWFPGGVPFLCPLPSLWQAKARASQLYQVFSVNYHIQWTKSSDMLVHWVQGHLSNRWRIFNHLGLNNNFFQKQKLRTFELLFTMTYIQNMQISVFTQFYAG